MMKNLAQKGRQVAAWLEFSEKAKKLLALLQITAAGSASLYKIDPDHAKFYGYIFLASMVVILIWSLIGLIFYRRSGLNILRFERSTGLLFDEKTLIPNVALRRETMQTILKHCESNGGADKLYALGAAIGKNFIECYREKKLLAAGGSSDGDEVLKQVFEYDSSSGMGKFELIRFDRRGRSREVEIAVWNPFVGWEEEKLSPFLQGYLAGVCSEIHAGTFTATAETVRTQGDNRIFDLTLKES
jgi:hypothetical protein